MANQFDDIDDDDDDDDDDDSFEEEKLKDYAIIRLDLTETITAYQLASMLGTFEGVYTTFLYIEKAKNSSQDEVMPLLFFLSRIFGKAPL